jgi:hypothetical protein
MMALTAFHDLECDHLDIKTALLNGDLEEEVYMTIAEGMIEPGQENMVARLKKSLYSLVQAPRANNKNSTISSSCRTASPPAVEIPVSTPSRNSPNEIL